MLSSHFREVLLLERKYKACKIKQPVFFSILLRKTFLLSVSEKYIILKYRSLNIKLDSVLVFLQQITRSYWK